MSTAPDNLPATVVRNVPVPSHLAQLGLKLGRDDASGLAVVVIPPEVRKALNVINPVSSFAQADPNWTPSIAVVQLDVALHSYNVSGKLAFNKQALELLGKAAGVLYTRTERVPRSELQEGERFAYRATVGFRRSDGTIDEVTRERGFIEEAERAEILEAVKKASYDGKRKFETDAAIEAEFQKRWLNELRFGPGKTESKAINRALRAGLQIPTSLPKNEFGRPFLVIGYSFTPDYDDPETKRLLVAAGLAPQRALYGQSSVARPELEAPEGTPDTPPADDGTNPVDDVSADASSGPVDQQADGGAAPLAGGAAAAPGQPEEDEPEPVEGDLDDEPSTDPEPEPEPDPEPEGIAETIAGFPAAVVEAAEQAKIPKGNRAGKTLLEITNEEDPSRFLKWALEERRPWSATFRTHVEVFAQARYPEVWAEVHPPDSEQETLDL